MQFHADEILYGFGQTTSTRHFMNCVYDLMIHYLCIAGAALTLTSCSVNISQVHTEGQASDVIDTTQRTDPQTDITTDLGAI